MSFSMKPVSFSKKKRTVTAVAAVAALVALSGSWAMRAGANTLASGPVTLSTIGTVTTAIPYSSGQSIEVSVTANTTLSQRSLGGASEPAMKAVECADPGGLVANLPTSPGNGHCDAQTVLQTSAVGADGIFEIADYPIYALPDGPTFGELSTSTPVCGTGSNECVLYLGPAPNNFAKPHLFSAPFSVLANDDDGGENPGDGSAQAAQTITITSTPPSPAVVGATYVPTATGGGSGNPVVFSVDSTSTSGACGLSGTTVDLTGIGTCVIDANQQGSAGFVAAPEVAQSIDVEGTQAIHFTTAPASPAIVGGTYAPAATGGGSGNPVVFTISPLSSPGACLVSGSLVRFVAAGTCTIDANQAGAAQYQAAPPVAQSVGIMRAGPQFTSANHDGATLGEAFTFHVTTFGSPAPRLKEHGKLPKGVAFDKATQRLVGTAAATTRRPGVGTYHVTFTATFGRGRTKQVVAQAFTLTVGAR